MIRRTAITALVLLCATAAAALEGTGVQGTPQGFSVRGLLLDVRLP